MLSINNQMMEPDELSHEFSEHEDQQIIRQMEAYVTTYTYQSIQQLKFELFFRMNTMRAARELSKSGAKFETFTTSYCNKVYWDLLPNGGFLLKPGVSPSTAILDITKNGSLYGFECSTAIAIVLYIATLYSIDKQRFNRLFERLYLMDWQFDEDLPIYQMHGNDYLPGDVLHFNNPDFNPKKPQWRAENVIYFGDDTYYGHGIGIRNSEVFINFLNKNRKEDPKHSAYLMSMITRPNYKAF